MKYWLLAVAIGSLLTLAICVTAVLWWPRVYYGLFVRTQMEEFPAFLHATWSLVPTHSGLYLMLWPWLTLGTFSIFSVSLGRARVRYAHLLRGVVYSSDAIVWVAPLLAALHVAPHITSLPIHRWEVLLVATATTTVMIWAAIRFIIAAKLYLNFRQSVLMAIFTQIVALFPLFLFWSAEVVYMRTMGRWLWSS